MKVGEDPCGSGQHPVVGARDHFNGPSGSTKGWVFLDELSYYKRVKKTPRKLRNLLVMKLHLRASPSSCSDAMAVGALNT